MTVPSTKEAIFDEKVAVKRTSRGDMTAVSLILLEFSLNKRHRITR